MENGYGYDDVYLVPNFGIVNSRSECDTSVRLGNMTFNLPVIPSNMKTVINADLAEYLAERNLFYIMHRFGVDVLAFAKRMRDKGLYVSISIGVNEFDLRNLEILKSAGIEPEYITIDVAHGYATYIKAAIKKVRGMFGNAFVIAGNVADYHGAKWLGECGASAVKVGIAAGAVCITAQKTGFSYPIFSSILDAAQAGYTLIADGGIKYHGDIAKALTAGATMVMAGGLFAGYDESPGEIIVLENGTKSKAYFGSASEYNKMRHKNVEGKRIFVPCRGPIQPLLDEIKEDLQSSISYAGGKDLSAFKYVKWGIRNGS